MENTDIQSKQKLLRCPRRHKVHSCKARADPEEAEEHLDPRAGPGAQAAAEGWAEAPHSPCCTPSPLPGQLEAGSEVEDAQTAPGTEEQYWMMLQSLAEEYVRQQIQSTEEKRPPRPLTHEEWEEHWRLHPCMEQGPAGPRRTRHKRKKTAGPYPLERCRVPSPSPCLQEELGLWAGSAGKALLKELSGEEQHWSNACQAGSDREESLSESPSNDPKKLEHYRGQGQLLKLFLQDTDQLASHGEDSKAQEEQQKKNKDFNIHTLWVNPVYPELQAELCSLEAEEADYDLPCLSPAQDRGPGQLLKLFLQDIDQPVSHGEDSKAQEEQQKKNKDVSIHTLWVNSLYPALQVEPRSLEAEEIDPDLPCTSPVPVAPMDTQPAAAALTGATEDEEQHVSATAQAQEVTKTAASAASGVQVAESESRAAAPHNPLPRQLEDLGQWAGPAGMALLAELRDKEGSHSEELRSGPATEWAEDTASLSSITEEESVSGSLQSDAWPEDTEPIRMTGKESHLVPVPHEAWAKNQDLSQSSEEETSSVSGEDQDLGCSSEEESTSGSLQCESWEEDQDPGCSSEEESTPGSLQCESWAETWGSEVCTYTNNGADQPQKDLICPYHTKSMLFYMGTGMESEESLSQTEDAKPDFREAARGTIQWEEELLKWDRRTFERLRGLHSAPAVPEQRPSRFRRVLKSLRRAFRSLRCLIPVLQCCQG